MPKSPESEPDIFKRRSLDELLDDDDAFQHWRRRERIKNIVIPIAGIIVSVLGGVGISFVRHKLDGAAITDTASKDVPSGSCAPGDLDCLDDRYYEENGFPFSPGSPDGCVLLCKDAQLTSLLCCLHVADDSSKCPPLDPDSTLPGGVEE